MKRPSSRTVKRGAAVGAAVAAIIAVSAPVVQKWEGLETTAYLDAVGIPTICFGETMGVKLGDTKSVEECKAMLEPRLAGFLAEMRDCTTVELPLEMESAFLSFSYNLGARTYCRNIAEKRLNLGKFEEACEAILLYNRAGGRVLRGLVRRRAEEHAMCVKGLEDI